jgi:hypothetical protein
MYPSSEEDRRGLVLLHNAIEKKLVELADKISNAQINLDDKDDKTFDRLMKAMIESKSIAENQLWLKVQLGIDKGKEDESRKKSRNPLEERAK